MSTYPKAPRSPHTSPTTGAIAEELGWTPQSSLGVAQLHAKHTNAYSLLPPLDTKAFHSINFELFITFNPELHHIRLGAGRQSRIDPTNASSTR